MILVTGATGNVGRPLVAQLINRRALVRAVTRNPATASLPPEAQIVQADPSKPETLERAREGVTAIFLNARAVQKTGPEVLAGAARAGVTRVVALAASNVDEDLSRQPSRWRGDFNRELEQAVIGSGLEWVRLRPNECASNYLTLWGAQLCRGDIIHGSYGASEHAPIDERDISAVAVAALLGDHLLGQTLTLTGPALSRNANSRRTWREFSNSFAVWAADHAAHFKRDAE